MTDIGIERLRKLPYLDVDALGGRTLKLMPLWDGTSWKMWADTDYDLIELKIVDTLESDYVAHTAAKESDLFIPFIHLMWQRLSYTEIAPLISAISDDFHSMGTSVAKLRFFANSSPGIHGQLHRFASTELEYLVTLARGVFDLVQEIISWIWKHRVRMVDPEEEKFRASQTLPETFSKLVLVEKARLRTGEEIQARFGLPKLLADEYGSIAPFFASIRTVRDRIVHGGGGFNGIFETERGFCVDPKRAPFNSFPGWLPCHYYNQNIVSILPWVAYVILQTIDTCNRLVDCFCQIMQPPREIAPGYTIFVRGPHNQAIVDLLTVHSGGSPWWDEREPQTSAKEEQLS